MQAQIDIAYDQLVQLVKQLPEKQWVQLKHEVEEKEKQAASPEMVSLLMSAPTFSKKQLNQIAKVRKEISQWRTK